MWSYNWPVPITSFLELVFMVVNPGVACTIRGHSFAFVRRVEFEYRPLVAFTSFPLLTKVGAVVCVSCRLSDAFNRLFRLTVFTESSNLTVPCICQFFLNCDELQHTLRDTYSEYMRCPHKGLSVGHVHMTYFRPTCPSAGPCDSPIMGLSHGPISR